MKKINVRTGRIISQALGTLREENHLDIYTIKDEIDEPLVYGVNWCAMGTQTAEATREFAKGLQKAAEIAEALNSLELVVDWNTEGSKIQVKEDMREEWKTWLPKFYEVVRLGCADLIEAGIDTMNKKFFEEV